jgi:hypothetical protein
VPSAISVNMLRWRLTTDAQPRWKNGQPAHSTTGVAKTNWIQLRDHVSHCVAGAFTSGDMVEQRHKVEELIETISRMTR